MQKAGGIIALIGGIFGIFASVFELVIGGIGTAVKTDRAGELVQLGFGGVAFSFIVIILGAICISAQRKLPGILLIVASLAGAVLGGTFTAVFLILSFVGGILAVIGTRKTHVAAIYPAPEPRQ